MSTSNVPPKKGRVLDSQPPEGEHGGRVIRLEFLLLLELLYELSPDPEDLEGQARLAVRVLEVAV